MGNNIGHDNKHINQIKQQLNKIKYPINDDGLVPSRYVGISFTNSKDCYCLKLRAGYTDLSEAERHNQQLKDNELIFDIHIRELNEWFNFMDNNPDKDVYTTQEEGKCCLTDDPTYRHQKFVCLSFRIVDNKRQIKVFSFHNSSIGAKIAMETRIDELEKKISATTHLDAISNSDLNEDIYVSEVGKWTPFQ